jgi:hypothetical protein
LLGNIIEAHWLSLLALNHVADLLHSDSPVQFLEHEIRDSHVVQVQQLSVWTERADDLTVQSLLSFVGKLVDDL